eukprot:403353177
MLFHNEKTPLSHTSTPHNNHHAINTLYTNSLPQNQNLSLLNNNNNFEFSNIEQFLVNGNANPSKYSRGDQSNQYMNPSQYSFNNDPSNYLNSQNFNLQAMGQMRGNQSFNSKHYDQYFVENQKVNNMSIPQNDQPHINSGSENLLLKKKKREIRISIGIRRAQKIRPVLMIVNKDEDTIDILKERIAKKFGVKKEAKIRRLLLSSGELIDDISLMQNDDKILVDLVKNDNIQGEEIKESIECKQVQHQQNSENESQTQMIDSNMNTMPSTSQNIKHTDDTHNSGIESLIVQVQEEDRELEKKQFSLKPQIDIPDQQNNQVEDNSLDLNTSLQSVQDQEEIDEEDQSINPSVKIDFQYPQLVANIPKISPQQIVEIIDPNQMIQIGSLCPLKIKNELSIQKQVQDYQEEQKLIIDDCQNQAVILVQNQILNDLQNQANSNSSHTSSYTKTSQQYGIQQQPQQNFGRPRSIKQESKFQFNPQFKAREYDQERFLMRDIDLHLKNTKYDNREEVIQKKRNRFKDEVKLSKGSMKKEEDLQNETINDTQQTQKLSQKKQDGRCQSKKSNCPFRMKFTKQDGQDYFTFFQALHYHNHPLIIGQKIKSSYNKRSVQSTSSFNYQGDGPGHDSSTKESPISIQNSVQSTDIIGANINTKAEEMVPPQNQSDPHLSETANELQIDQFIDKTQQQILSNDSNQRYARLKNEEKAQRKKKNHKRDLENEYDILRYSQSIRRPPHIMTTYKQDMQDLPDSSQILFNDNYNHQLTPSKPKHNELFENSQHLLENYVPTLDTLKLSHSQVQPKSINSNLYNERIKLNGLLKKATIQHLKQESLNVNQQQVNTQYQISNNVIGNMSTAINNFDNQDNNFEIVDKQELLSDHNLSQDFLPKPFENQVISTQNFKNQGSKPLQRTNQAKQGKQATRPYIKHKNSNTKQTNKANVMNQNNNNQLLQRIQDDYNAEQQYYQRWSLIPNSTRNRGNQSKFKNFKSNQNEDMLLINSGGDVEFDDGEEEDLIQPAIDSCDDNDIILSSHSGGGRDVLDSPPISKLNSLIN